MKKIRLLLADDHTVLRAGLRMLLNAQPDMEVVGEAVDGAEAVERALELKPDVVLMDITMGGMSGLAATREIKDRIPQIKVLVLTMHDDEEYLRQMLEAGATGYVLKRAADTELVVAIRAVQRGEVFLYPSFTRVLLGDLLRKRGLDSDSQQDSYELLSQREREVLHLVALGYASQQIADQLFLSVKTIETYRARLMEKLNLKGRAALVRYALRKGLLDDEIGKHRPGHNHAGK
ncbi:MAG: response regulator transcription factor [Anaerolineales bacterium]|nr:response regulator transcription factor [Anaerolineales bacterium]